MNTNVYIIAMHETSDSINFGISFHPEAYLSKEKAEKRLEFLKSELPEDSGFYYSFECLRTKEIFPWNVKVGDFLVIYGPCGGEYQTEILGINKGRATMFHASKWTFHTREIFGFKDFSFYGKGFAEGNRIKAEKVRILK